ncbi:SLATT domain-containing protein [Tardiphaga sp. 172_B4_N1_3]|uniref:SLATT domain-containing protein n=1 Tax=Tardiphaga sp. 172_B4_N1_3 TaxID=3240787 RepID=UPI003F887BBF
MAEDIRDANSSSRELDAARQQSIIDECLRQEESCLYTSVTLHIWLRRVRRQKQFFAITPVLLGGFAGLSLLKNLTPEWFVALLAFVSGLLPALSDALSIQTSVDETTRLAAEYKSLQDRFRRVARITASQDVNQAEKFLSDLMDRMDVARSTSITPPEWAFIEARKKIAAGHYSFTVDGN